MGRSGARPGVVLMGSILVALAGASAAPAAAQAPAERRCPGAPFRLPVDGYFGWVWRQATDEQDSHFIHTGADIVGPPGATVYPPAAGTVQRIDRSRTSANLFLPDVEGGTSVYITHIIFDDWVDVGAAVDPARPIGHLAELATPHVHISIAAGNGPWHHHNDLEVDQTQDPSPYFGARLDSTRGATAFQATSDRWADACLSAGGDADAVTVTVDGAHPEWTETGMTVAAGDILVFTATGSIFWDPAVSEPEVGPEGASWDPAGVGQPSDFLLQDDPIASLIGSIGDEVFPIGTGRTLAAPAGGPLRLGMNERWVDGAWDDNHGAWTVTVKRAGPSTAGDDVMLRNTIDVPADALDGVAAVTVTQESWVDIKASGEWCYVDPALAAGSAFDPGCTGPDGVPTRFDVAARLPDAPIGALIGTFGGPWFTLGHEAGVRVPKGRTLTLSFNDNPPGDYADNEGKVTVDLVVRRMGP